MEGRGGKQKGGGGREESVGKKGWGGGKGGGEEEKVLVIGVRVYRNVIWNNNVEIELLKGDIDESIMEVLEYSGAV